MRPAVFFDRDGVLNEDIRFPHKPEHIRWVPGALDALCFARKQGYLVFVVTNQSGVARGLYTEEDVKRLHDWMQIEFRKHGAEVDAFAYCPHHPTEGVGGYKKECNCRKPKPGMITDLMKAYDVDAEHSFLIGDRASDIEAAEAAGIKGYLYSGGGILTCLQSIMINTPLPNNKI